RHGVLWSATRHASPIAWPSPLKQYFPQALAWFEHRDTLLFCDFLCRWPTLKHVKRARRSTLQAFFHEHNVRFSSVTERRIHSIRDATALTAEDAVIQPCQLLVQALVEQFAGDLTRDRPFRRGDSYGR